MTSNEGDFFTQRYVETAKDIGQAIRLARKRDNLTQRDLADLLNLGLRFVGDVERGKPTVELGKVLILLHGVGLDLHIKSRGR